jgi:DNA-binding NarL/FixJ family response regulator
MQKNAINIAILEDHPMMREAVAQNLVRHLPDARIIYSGKSVSHFLQNHPAPEQSSKYPTFVILDLDLGDDTDALENLKKLTEHKFVVIVVSALASTQTVRLMLGNGSAAYVSKNSDAESLRDAVKATINGDQYMSPDIAIALLSGDQISVNLSEKERQALTLYASGMKLEAVAESMTISRSTASEYIQRARKKYGKAGINLPNKTDLYRQAQKDGLIK